MRRLLRIRSVERDVGEELAFHFAEAVDDLMRLGRTRAQAEAEVRRRFGDEGRYRRELMNLDRSMERRMRWSDRLEAFGEAMRLALRNLVRTPGMTAGIVLVFALGIGANATMLEIVDRLLLRAPDHIAAPEQVHRVVVDRFIDFRGERDRSEYLTYPDYRDLHAAETLKAVAGYTTRELTLGHGESAHRADGVLVTGGYFSLLGVRPHLGRFFTDAEARIGGERVAVLGYGYWQSQYGGSSAALGQTIDLGGAPYTIIGVAPRGLTTLDLTPAQVWLPLEVAQTDHIGDAWVDARNWWWMRAVVRRAPDASVAQAESEATALHLAGRAEQIAEGEYGDDTRVLAYPLTLAESPGVESEPVVAKWLAGVALVVLLIASINVANLLFARTLRRQRETAIQLALGVTRARLISRIVLEGALLGILGGAAAVAVAYWGGGALRRMLLPDVAWSELGLGGRVLAFTAALSVLAGVLSALMPAVQASRRDVGDALRVSAGGITRSALRVRTALSFAQAALSVLLLVGAGLFVRSIVNVRNIDHGFDTRGVLFADVVTARDAIPEGEHARLLGVVLERVQRLPGVHSAALTSAMPFWSYEAYGLKIDGVDSLPTLPTGSALAHVVTRDYFETMGMSIVRGRGFGDGSAYVAVVNETMARIIDPAGAVLGRCLYLRAGAEDAPPCAPIVGVVENATTSDLDQEPTMQYYLNAPSGWAYAAEFLGRGSTLMLRVDGDPAAVTAAARHEILAIDPRYRFVQIEPFADRLRPLARAWELGATLFSVFGLLALLVAGVGLYSVLAFDVTQRTREMGLRSALGAPVSRLLRMIVTRGMRVTTVGVATGLLAAALLAPRLEPLLFRVPPVDPATYLGVAGVLLLVAVAASWLPAWRAARVDPVVALRNE